MSKTLKLEQVFDILIVVVPWLFKALQAAVKGLIYMAVILLLTMLVLVDVKVSFSDFLAFYQSSAFWNMVMVGPLASVAWLVITGLEGRHPRRPAMTPINTDDPDANSHQR